MPSAIRKETVNGETTVELVRTLHEVPTDDGMNLVMVHKRPAHRAPLAPAVLVHGLGQNRFSWTLSRRSLENYLVAQGFETFNAELRGHGLSRANGCEYPAHFETYVESDLPAILRTVGELTDGQRAFYLGHSLGATIGYCLGAQHHDRLAGIVSIGGPYDFGAGNLFLRLLAKTGVLLDKVIHLKALHPDAFYIDVLGIIARHGLFFFDSPIHRIPLHIWRPGSTERDILEERIDKGFDRTSFNVFWLLVEWGSGGRLARADGGGGLEERLDELRIPIFFVVGDDDDCVPEEAVREAYWRVPSTDKTLTVFGGEQPDLHWGHCDLICGREAPQVIWPAIARWMTSRLPSDGAA